eukprot:scaffold48912_cov74-Phaeocystis_antarctica.AAC.1
MDRKTAGHVRRPVHGPRDGVPRVRIPSHKQVHERAACARQQSQPKALDHDGKPRSSTEEEDPRVSAAVPSHPVVGWTLGRQPKPRVDVARNEIF